MVVISSQAVQFPRRFRNKRIFAEGHYGVPLKTRNLYIIIPTDSEAICIRNLTPSSFRINFGYIFSRD